MRADPDFQCRVPILDGDERHSDNVIFGTNLDLGDTSKSSSTGFDGLSKL